MKIRLDVTSLVDPRGESSLTPTPLATRRGSLEGSSILIFDNGKLHLGYGKLAVMADVIKRHLREEQQVSACDALSKNPTVFDRDGLLGFADQISQKKYAGVIIALCDQGVTQNCCFIAARLESNGIPTVLVCSEEGLKLARVMVQGLAPGLPLCSFRQDIFADEEQIAAETKAILPQIVAGLTRAGEGPSSAPGDTRVSFWNASGLGSRSLSLPPGGSEATVPAGAFSEDVYQSLCEANLGDGLPVIPPTQDRVEAMLSGTDREPEDVVIECLYPSGARLDVCRLAVNAVMAGCAPEHFPIVITAFEAMAEPPYRLFQAAITAHPGGNAVIVSGPLAKRIGIHSGQGCLGPGFRANATIGRAISLSLINVARAVPGSSDLAPLGSPAKYSYCFAEDIDSNPWRPLHVELQDRETTTVTVLKCEGPINLADRLSSTPDHLLEGFATACTSLVCNNAYAPCTLLLILNPQHAALIANAGWSKEDVKGFMFEKVRNPRSKLKGRGMDNVWPPEFDHLDPVPVMSSPEECLIVVAGGPGTQSAVSLPWGFCKAVTKPVLGQGGVPLR
ncbi:MAG: hypothetical protein HYX92_06800 [Chloroflexi bacterium]|nr:hypothetical protein [Chloroflexota bacterium]